MSRKMPNICESVCLCWFDNGLQIGKKGWVRDKPPESFIRVSNWTIVDILSFITGARILVYCVKYLKINKLGWTSDLDES